MRTFATSVPDIVGSNNSQREDLTGKNVPCNSTDFAAFFYFSGSPSSVIWYTIHFIQFGLEKAAHQLFLEHVLRSELLQGNPAAGEEFCDLFLDPCQRVLRHWFKEYHYS